MHAAINEAGPWLKKLLYREIGTVKAQALNSAGEIKHFFRQAYAAFRCTNDGEMLIALKDTLDNWKHTKPAFYQHFVQYYPELQPHNLARMKIGELRRRVRAIVENEQGNCEQGFLSHKVPEVSLLAMVVSFLENCAQPGLRHQVDLENWPDEYQLALIHNSLGRLCQERKDSGQPKFPFLIELQSADIQQVESLTIDSLCNQAQQALNKTALSEGEYRQLSALYAHLLEEVHRRSEGDVFLIDGIYSER
ncbi:hypothetical protein NX722_15580 [Endozoicomonas gorgoniicola]|uniref:DNA-binding domain-containing protein n=1 Tax=Endozoicomonas gorgoniicola TaxID=1234144 RepID=A0ABT3MXA8_9GAMM|nr:hypothetical protein [Endozoicomonas gorgoniicola]MCW7554014.1 hypothetical protein [Endozoicomonas gorgoniicola]